MAIIKSAETDFGRVLVNQKENDGYVVDYPPGGDIVSAHSNSFVEVELEADATIQGGVSSVAEPFAFQCFKIDGKTVGKLKDSDFETYPIEASKGVVRLEVTSHNNASGHAHWRIFEDCKSAPLKIAVACGSERFAEKIEGCETASTGYQTETKNFATLLNEAVATLAQKNGGPNCAVAICDVESAIEKDVLFEAAKFVSDERCVVIPKRILSVKKNKRKSDDPSAYYGIGAIVVTLNAWNASNGFDERIEGFAKAAENFIVRFRAGRGSVVKRPIGFEGVKKFHPNIRKGRESGDVADVAWGSIGSRRTRSTATEAVTTEETPPAVELATAPESETPKKDDAPAEKKKASSRKTKKTNVKEKKDEE